MRRLAGRRIVDGVELATRRSTQPVAAEHDRARPRLQMKAKRLERERLEADKNARIGMNRSQATRRATGGRDARLEEERPNQDLIDAERLERERIGAQQGTINIETQQEHLGNERLEGETRTRAYEERKRVVSCKELTQLAARFSHPIRGSPLARHAATLLRA